MAKETIQNKEKEILKIAAKYDDAADGALKAGTGFIIFAVTSLSAGIILNLYFLENSIISIVNIIPINVFLLAGVTLFSTLAIFYLRVGSDRQNKSLDIYLNSIYRL